ncbi:MAG: WD40 repeat domain-containing protein [Thermoplasmata archaeon]
MRQDRRTMRFAKVVSFFIVILLPSLAFLPSISQADITSTASRVLHMNKKWDIDTTSYRMDWHPSEPIIAFGTSSNEIHFRDKIDGSLIAKIELFEETQYGAGFSYLDYSPNGSWIAFPGYIEIEYGLYDKRWIKIYDTATLSLVFELESQFNISYFDWSPDGDRFAFGTSRTPIEGNGSYNWTYIVDSTSRRILDKFQSPAYIHEVRWSPDGAELVVLSQSGLQKWNESGTVFIPHTFPDDTGYGDLQWFSDGKSVLFYARSTIKAFYPRLMVISHYLELDENIGSFALSPDDSAIAVFMPSHGLTFYRVETLERIDKVFTGPYLLGLKWSPDGSSLAGTSIGTITVISYAEQADSMLPLLLTIAVILVVSLAALAYARRQLSRRNE